MSTSSAALRAATRGSPLARWQSDHVAALLGRGAGAVVVETVVIETEGDRRADVPIRQIAGRGVFVKEVQAAVLDGRADFAVHSAKDLPSSPTPGLSIVAVPERGDPRDALVGGVLTELAPGALVATGSVRRRAQLAGLRPDLTFADLRGSIDTRLAKAGRYSAIVMAAVALARLERRPAVVDVLDADVMVPQVGQGALALECRTGDEAVARVLATVDHRPSHLALDAERAWLATLGGGCDVPAGALARVDDDGGICLSGLLASLDGHIVVRATLTGRNPAAVGRTLARRLLDLYPNYRTV
ncbi:MAG: hydroxymethylbilane synthase [Acidimicrobiales bacterium]